MGVDCERRVSLRCGLSVCARIVSRFVHSAIWFGLDLAGNVNFAIEGCTQG